MAPISIFNTPLRAQSSLAFILGLTLMFSKILPMTCAEWSDNSSNFWQQYRGICQWENDSSQSELARERWWCSLMQRWSKTWFLLKEYYILFFKSLIEKLPSFTIWISIVASGETRRKVFEKFLSAYLRYSSSELLLS